MPKLGLGLSLARKRFTSSSSPIPTSNLSLWLKADAGVTTDSYSYKSNITLSLAGESSINGSYTIVTPPPNAFNSYVLSGPNNNRIEVRPNSTPRYRLYNIDNSTGSTSWFYSFTSSDGVTWTAVGKKPVSITLSGLTGVSSASNGTYNTFQWDSGNGSFISNKSIVGGVDTNIQIEMVPNGSSSAYILDPVFLVSATQATGWGIGSWTIEEGTGTPVGTGTLYPTGIVPTGAVTTTNVNTTNVTAWADQSGSGNNANSDDSNPKPLFSSSSINSKPAVLLRDSSWMVTPANSIGSDGNISVFVAMRNNASEATTKFLLKKGDSSDYANEVWAFSIGDGFGFLDAENEVWNFSDYTIPASTSILTAISNGGASSVFRNGTSVGDPATTSGGLMNGSSQAIGIGASNNGSFGGVNADIAEIIMYSRTLTTPERQAVEAYLNTKYAIY